MEAKIFIKQHGLNEFLKQFHVQVKNRQLENDCKVDFNHILGAGVLYLKKSCGLVKGDIIKFMIEDFTHQMGIAVNLVIYFETADYDEMLVEIIKVHSEASLP